MSAFAAVTGSKSTNVDGLGRDVVKKHRSFRHEYVERPGFGFAFTLLNLYFRVAAET